MAAPPPNPPEPRPVLPYADGSAAHPRRRWVFVAVLAVLGALVLVALVAEVHDRAVIRAREEELARRQETAVRARAAAEREAGR